MNEELLALIESVKTNAVGDTANAEFVEAIAGIVPGKPIDITLDSIKTYVKDTDAGKEYLKNLQDNSSKSAITDFKAGTDYEGLIKESNEQAVAKALAEFRKANKLNPETPEEKVARLDREVSEKKVTDLEKSHADLMSKLERKEHETIAMSKLTDSKLSANLINFVMGKDLATTTENIIALKAVLDKEISTAIETKFKAIGRKPEELDAGKKTVTQAMVEDLAKKAKATGKLNDRVAYAEAKQLLDFNNK